LEFNCDNRTVLLKKHKNKQNLHRLCHLPNLDFPTVPKMIQETIKRHIQSAFLSWSKYLSQCATGTPSNLPGVLSVRRGNGSWPCGFWAVRMGFDIEMQMDTYQA